MRNIDLLDEAVQSEADARTDEIIAELDRPLCEYGRARKVIAEADSSHNIVEANIANELLWELRNMDPCGVCVRCRLSKLS